MNGEHMHKHWHARSDQPSIRLTPPARPLDGRHSYHGWLLGHQKAEPNYSGDLGDFALFVAHEKDRGGEWVALLSCEGLLLMHGFAWHCCWLTLVTSMTLSLLHSELTISI
ncbi:hypothetical protein F5148DRAFT_1202345 [Russula earlei]|uniref:Uncharacterized protein n=1 Tax=Russula earlei TaxID=71964 RepID=A0ACC0UA62_9AGAM|nr:hypothetical protein F5148DRAFT_1202345 [Russula earlei]